MHALTKELLKHKAVIGALIGVAVIALASLAYFLIATHVPGFSYVEAKEASIHQDITATGSVTPVQNPDLSFTAGGRVTYVNAVVGQEVAAGTVLATLDTGILSANLQAAQAGLAQVAAPVRPVDLASAQADLDKAKQDRQNAYDTFPTTLLSTLSKTQSAIIQTDPLFKFPSGSLPRYDASYSDDYDTSVRIQKERGDLNTELDAWQKELSGEDTSSLSPAEASQLASEAETHLDHARTYLDDVANTIRRAAPSDGATQEQLTAMLATVTTARGTIDSVEASLQASKQSFSSADLAVQSAQADLASKQAGATPQAIAVQQAQVAAASAQLAQSEIIAPFAGTVGAVAVKSGDVVAPNTVAVSLVPHGSYQVEAELSELEMAKLAVGDTADVTLDAYGSAQVFSGTVSSIATAPVVANGGGTPSYKVIVVLDTQDPRVTVGMHANLTIHAGSKDNALTIPRSAIIMNGDNAFVVKKVAGKDVQVPVTIGLESDDSAEVLSGLSAGDSVARIGGN